MPPWSFDVDSTLSRPGWRNCAQAPPFVSWPPEIENYLAYGIRVGHGRTRGRPFGGPPRRRGLRPYGAARPVGPVLPSRPDGGLPPDADLVFGGDGATTVLVCGGYHFAPGRSHPLIDILPPLIHLRTAGAAAGHALSLVVELLTREVASRGIGTAT